MSIRLSGYGNVATSLPRKASYRDHFARTGGVSSAFSWLHDWIPLGRLNNVTAVRSQGTLLPLVAVALVQSVAFTFALLFSLSRFGRPYPHWLYMWLWISYSLIFVGQIRAWWIPYLFHLEPGRAAGYRTMFSKCSATHTPSCPFVRLVPNTAHVMLHLATAATLFILLAR